jgi:cytochrome o ubiquinol oxidase subunit 2
MKRVLGLALPLIAIATLVAVLVYLTKGQNMGILSPSGEIANKQRDLIYVASGLMMLVLVPVYFLTFKIALQYHEDNQDKNEYKPDWDNNRLLESIWWGIPMIIIGILVAITWQSTHALDPFKPLESTAQPVKVQVIAMEWKWLFIYPDYDIASVNSLNIPADRPINFTITSDAPMNSFWIPQLGGQIYAMAGMSTKLHLNAHEPGNYRGVSANISGEGFADMHFMTHATSENEFDAWIASTKDSTKQLDQKEYDRLNKPGTIDSPIFYKDVSPGLYDKVIMKYMMPMTNNHSGDEKKPKMEMSSHDH